MKCSRYGITWSEISEKVDCNKLPLKHWMPLREEERIWRNMRRLRGFELDVEDCRTLEDGVVRRMVVGKVFLDKGSNSSKNPETKDL